MKPTPGSCIIWTDPRSRPGLANDATSRTADACGQGEAFRPQGAVDGNVALALRTLNATD